MDLQDHDKRSVYLERGGRDSELWSLVVLTD